MTSWKEIDWDGMGFDEANKLGESMGLKCTEFQYETDYGCDSYLLWAPTRYDGKLDLLRRIKAGTAPDEADSCQIDVLFDGLDASGRS